MATAYIGLGSNLGDRCANIRLAWERLGRVKGVRLLQLSRPYRSEPVGMESANWFINAVGSLQSFLQPAPLLSEMLAIETALGRKRGGTGRFEDRTIDLDLLYWGKMICEEPGVILPHPEIANRLFVLLPLAEIGPDVLHPVLQKTSRQMAQEYMTEEAGKGSGTEVRQTSWSAECNEVAP